MGFNRKPNTATHQNGHSNKLFLKFFSLYSTLNREASFYSIQLMQRPRADQYSVNKRLWLLSSKWDSCVTPSVHKAQWGPLNLPVCAGDDSIVTLVNQRCLTVYAPIWGGLCHFNMSLLGAHWFICMTSHYYNNPIKAVSFSRDLTCTEKWKGKHYC